MCWVVLFSNSEDKARKSGDLTGACSPITLPVTIELGESMLVALNALAPVLAIGGGECFCADSLDALFVIDGCWLSSP